jgi:two-component system, chemotaxis family, chemotaxis protein CheY
LKPTPAEDRLRAPNGSSPRRRKAGPRTLRIAIVDDDEELIAVIAILVRSLGHKVELEAKGGAEIISAIRSRKVDPDVILMDYRMPVMNGIQAAKAIRDSHPGPKMIIVTADDSAKAEAAGEGFVYISKPFSSQDLVRALEDAGH